MDFKGSRPLFTITPVSVLPLQTKAGEKNKSSPPLGIKSLRTLKLDYGAGVSGNKGLLGSVGLLVALLAKLFTGAPEGSMSFAET